MCARPGKCWACAITLLLACAVQAKEYGHYDVARVVDAAKRPAHGAPAVDLPYFGKILDDLGAHATIWPARFDAPDDQRRAQHDVIALSLLLDPLIDRLPRSPPLLLRMGMLHGYGHNLEVPGAAKQAVAFFDRLLKLTPEDPQANLRYGMFLAMTSTNDKAVPYLEKAKLLGVPGADYWLGLTYSSLGDKQKAVARLNDYIARFPRDRNAVRLLDAVKNDHIEVKRDQPSAK